MKVDFYVRKYLNGNGDAFTNIYELTKKEVYLSIYTYIKDKETIKDLMQDVYMKVIDSIDMYEVGTNFKAWISRVARNITINYLNKANRMIVKDPIEESYVFDKEENIKNVDRCLSYLDGMEKDVFTLRILLGYKFDDIDEILGLKLHQSYYIFKKIIQKLKNLL